MRSRWIAGALAFGLVGCTAASEPAPEGDMAAESASEVEMVAYTCPCGKTKHAEAGAAAPHC